MARVKSVDQPICTGKRIDKPGHASVGGTFPLTGAAVATDPAGQVQLPGADPRVHRRRLLDDEAIGNQLPDRLSRIGVANLGDFVGVEPDLVLAAAEDRRGQALLRRQIRPGGSAHHSFLAVRVAVSSTESEMWSGRATAVRLAAARLNGRSARQGRSGQFSLARTLTS